MQQDSFKQDKRDIRWISQAIGPYRGRLIYLILLNAAVSVLDLLIALQLKTLIDAAVAGEKEVVIHSAYIFAALMIADILLAIFFRYFRERTSYRIEQHMQGRFFYTLLTGSYDAVTNKHSEDWMNRLRVDTSAVSEGVTVIPPAFTGILIHVLGTLYLLYRHVPDFLPVVLIGGLLVALLNIIVRKALKQRHREFREALGEKNRYMVDHLTRLVIVKAFGREKVVSENADQYLESLFQKRLRKLRMVLMRDGAQSGAGKLATLLVVVYCAFQILNGRLSYGTCVMLFRLLGQIKGPLSDISRHINDMYEMFVAAERLKEAEDCPSEESVLMKSEEQIRAFYEERFSGIVFSDASFRYEEQTDEEGKREAVFSHVDLQMPRQCCAAFTGPTGSGKSTIFKILLSLYPLQGGKKVLLEKDGTEQELDASWRGLFAYVPQGSQLMTGSIREMVTFGSREDMKKEQQIWEALDAACAGGFVRELPEGLDTMIKEGGLGLSEGQLQRIAIARALFTGRPILLLDEATSALDEATERELLSHLKTMTDRTILIVTHRPGVLSICDREISIASGRIVQKILPREEDAPSQQDNDSSR